MTAYIVLDNGIAGETYYARVRNLSAQWANNDSEAFEEYNASNWADYLNVLVREGSSPTLKVSFPAWIADGTYDFVIHRQEGGSPSETDEAVAGGRKRISEGDEVDETRFTTDQIADVNQGVADALNAAIPGSPTENSINERVKAIDDKLPSGVISDFDETANSVNLAANQSGATVGTVNNLGTNAKAHVNAEVADVLKVDTLPEQAAGAPPSTPTVFQAIWYLFARMINKQTSTDSEEAIFNGSGTKVAKATVTTDGVTTTKEKMEAP